MSLITNFEIKQKSVAEKEYPMDKLSRYKDIVESDYFRNCFGVDFYEILKGVKVDWSTVTEWTAGSYASGTLKSWKGEILKSTVNSNTQEPSLTATQWTAADKFTVSEYDTLWKNYLGQIIANKIILQCAVPDTVRATAKGLMKSTEDNSNSIPADKADIGLWFNHVKNFIDIAESEMKHYVKSQYDKFVADPNTGFDYKTAKVKFIADCENCITTSNKVNRRIGFND